MQIHDGLIIIQNPIILNPNPCLNAVFYAIVLVHGVELANDLGPRTFVCLLPLMHGAEFHLHKLGGVTTSSNDSQCSRARCYLLFQGIFSQVTDPGPLKGRNDRVGPGSSENYRVLECACIAVRVVFTDRITITGLARLVAVVRIVAG